MVYVYPIRYPEIKKTTSETTAVTFTVFDLYRMIRLYMPQVMEGVILDEQTGLPTVGQDVTLTVYQPTSFEVNTETQLNLTIRRKI